MSLEINILAVCSMVYAVISKKAEGRMNCQHSLYHRSCSHEKWVKVIPSDFDENITWHS